MPGDRKDDYSRVSFAQSLGASGIGVRIQRD
jgi:hypothetical protein